MNTQSAELSSPSVLGALVNEVFDRLNGGEEIDVEQLAADYPEYGERLVRVIPILRDLTSLDWCTDGSDQIDRQLSTAEHPTLGDFRLLRQIGRGGMGIVYEAQQLTIDRRVAVKVLPLAALVDARALHRFRNEVAAIATLEHPHIVSVYSVGEERGIHYYAMRLVRGQSLAVVIRELRARKLQSALVTGASLGEVVSDLEGESRNTNVAATHSVSDSPSNPSQSREIAGETVARGASRTTPSKISDPRYYRNVVDLILSAADALEHAHQHGIVHRDIKPGNLLLDTDGNLFVTDFGLARIEAGSGVTLTGDLMGTLRYMSPEQVLGGRVIVDHRTDVYSLGATLYELLTLRPMWEVDDRADLIRKISFDEPPPPRKINPAIPVDLETIVLKSINKNPADRYDSAANLSSDLERWMGNRPIQARRTSIWQLLTKWSYRHRRMITTAVVVALVSLASGLFLTWRAYKEKAVEQQRAQNNYRVAINTLDDLVQNASQLERMVDIEGWRRTTLQRALNHYDAFVSQNAQDPKLGNELLRVREKQAAIHLLLENFDQAEKIARSGIQLATAHPDSMDRIVVANTWRRLATAYHQQARTQPAADAWQQGYQLIQRFAEKGGLGASDDHLHAAMFLRAYADWQIESASPGFALQLLKSAADQCRLTISGQPEGDSATAGFLLCEIKEDMGDHYRRGSNDARAKVFYDEALSLARDLGETRGLLQVQAKCLRQLGELALNDHSTIAQAEARLRDAVQIYERLVEDYPWDVYYRGERARLFHMLAIALKKNGKDAESTELLNKAANPETVSIRFQPQRAEHRLFWAQLQGTLANIARDLQQTELARKYYESALEHFSQLAERWPDHRRIREDQALTHNDYARMILDQPGAFGNKTIAQAAEQQIRQALEIFTQLKANFPDLKRNDQQFPEISGYYSVHLRNTYTLLAKCMNAAQRHDQAIEALKNVKAEFDRVPRLQSPKARYEMADTLLDLAGTCLMRDDDPVKVEQMYREGLEMMTAAFDEDPMVVKKSKYTEELITHYWGLAQALYEQERYQESKKEFERARSFGPMWVDGLNFYAGHLLDCPEEQFRDYRAALECYQEILERGPSRGSKDDRFVAQYKRRIGICHYRLGQYKQAKQQFEELLTDPRFNDKVDSSDGYYMVMTLGRIDEADDTEGDFRKEDAQEGYDMAWQQHQKLLREGKITGDDIQKYERLRQEAAEAIGIDPEMTEQEKAQVGR